MPPPPHSSRAKPTFVSHAQDLETDYVIYVDAPDTSKHPGPWPLAIFVDGDYTFEPASRAARRLRGDNLIPPTLVVAIGYGKPFGDSGNHRGRDYTPDAHEMEPASGGADRFLAHLTGPLWRELTRRYPVSDDKRFIGGHSIGGLFALHALFQTKPFFAGALAGAPSVWWAQHAFLARLRKLQAQKPVLPGHLFLGIGERDTPSSFEDLDLLEKQLATQPFEGLQISVERFPDRDHYNVMPDLIDAGFRALLGT